MSKSATGLNSGGIIRGAGSLAAIAGCPKESAAAAAGSGIALRVAIKLFLIMRQSSISNDFANSELLPGDNPESPRSNHQTVHIFISRCVDFNIGEAR